MMGVLTNFQKVLPGSHIYPIKVRRGSLGYLARLTIARLNSTTISDYQYLKKSSVPTSHFQESLPRLPIPRLEESCQKYIEAQYPLHERQKIIEIQTYVNDFLSYEGLKCQKRLVEENEKNKHTSYITQSWFDMYLKDRKPLPINFNPFLVFVRNPDESYNSQLVKASNLLIASLRFYKSLHSELLEPEVYHMHPKISKTLPFKIFTGLLPRSISWFGAYLFKAFPLDMSQYYSLFNTTRVPIPGKDFIKHSHGKKHIVVMRRGNFYVFDAIDNNGNIMAPSVIVSNIKCILQRDDPAAEHPVGLLTTEDRDTWADSRLHLKFLGNSEVLDLIDSSLLNLVLDEESPGEDPVSLIRLYLHADGTNRWFDKSISLIVTKDGHAGVNFEHSWGDGVAVLRYFDEIHSDITSKPRVHPDAINPNAIQPEENNVHKLEFYLDDKMKNIIADAKRKYENTYNSLEVRVMLYEKFGRQACKALNVSPDAVMQLAFQIAHDKIKGKHVATYESCSTAAFKHGRTETVRPCTVDTQAFCRALRQGNSVSDLQDMLLQCSRTHSRLIKEAAMGLGFDRHLFTLKLKAEELDLKPKLYLDPAYSELNHIILSTSTLSSDALLVGAFGPVVLDGFGIGYKIQEQNFGNIVTNYKTRSDGSDFVQALEEALDQLNIVIRCSK